MFRIVGLDPAPFLLLFELSDAQLHAQGMRRVRADADVGFPCRASLEDAAAGEELLLLPWRHHAVDSPYQASGPIYLRRHARQASLAPGAVPACVSRRLISLRAYDHDALMCAADVVEGADVGEGLAKLFARAEVAYVHLHNARPGCYSCAALRS